MRRLVLAQLFLGLAYVASAQDVPYSEIADQAVNTNGTPITSEFIVPPVPSPDVSALSIPSATTFDALYNVGRPPDCSGAVSSSNVVSMMNFAFLVQTRTGTVLTNQPLPFFWQSTNYTLTGSAFDPVVIFDPHQRRFIATSVHGSGSTNSGILIGVSMSEDPRGAWNLRRVQADTNGDNWADFPVIAFNDRFIVINAAMVNNETGANAGAKILVFDKTNLYAGNFSAPRVITRSERGLYPISTMDAGSTNMFLLANVNGNDDGSGYLRFAQITGTVSNAQITGERLLEVARTWATTVGTGSFAPQADTTDKINILDARMRATMYKNGQIHAVHMIYVPASNPTRSILQYFVIEQNGRFTSQTIDDGSSFYAYPNLAVNDFGDVLIGYAKFRTNIYPSAAYLVREYHKPRFTPEHVFASGEAPYRIAVDLNGRRRWGDYTAAALDPSNGKDFWTLGQYGKLTNAYSTRWAKVTLDSATNNHFAHSLTLSGSALTNSVDTERLTKESGEPQHISANYVSAWFSWTAPASGQVSISSGSSTVPTALAVYTGNSVSNLSLIVQSAAASPYFGTVLKIIPNVVFSASASTTYRIAVLVHTNEYRTTEIRLQQQLAPLFVLHPTPATNEVVHGYSVTLQAFAIGNPVPTFQWKRNGVNISGATSTNYTIASMSAGDEGAYTCTASNSSGTATSMSSFLDYFPSGATPIEDSRWTNNAFKLTINNVAGYNYVVLASTNLSSWTALSTNTVPFTFSDVNATNFKYRFYRSQFLP